MGLLRFGDDPEQFTEIRSAMISCIVSPLENREARAAFSRNRQDSEPHLHRSATICP
jgi:hypothetical protein